MSDKSKRVMDKMRKKTTFFTAKERIVEGAEALEQHLINNMIKGFEVRFSELKGVYVLPLHAEKLADDLLGGKLRKDKHEN